MERHHEEYVTAAELALGDLRAENIALRMQLDDIWENIGSYVPKSDPDQSKLTVASLLKEREALREQLDQIEAHGTKQINAAAPHPAG